MKISKFKSAKLFKSFELGESQLSTLVGGAGTGGGAGGSGQGGPTKACNYHEIGNEACSVSCPDSTLDYNGNG